MILRYKDKTLGGGSSTPTIEEYDTADGWHVRKHSDGYVEMFYESAPTLIQASEFNSASTKWGNLFTLSVTTGIPYPISLAQKYFENFSIHSHNSTRAFFWYLYSQGTLPQSGAYAAMRPESLSADTYIIFNLSVSGRWK